MPPTPADRILADFQESLPDDWSIRRLDGSSDDVPCELLFSGGGFEVERLPGDRLRLGFAPFASFEIDRLLKTCGVVSGDGLTPATLQHLLFDQILPRLIAQSGTLVLHAAAVLTPLGALLFLGGTGQGKSTLAASLASRFPLLGDDAVLVRPSACGPRCRSTYASLRLYEDSIAAVFPEPPQQAPVAQYTAKLAVRGPAAADGEAAIAGLFLLDSHPDSSVAVTPLGGAEACMALAEHSFWLDPDDRSDAARRLRTASEIVDAVSVFRLSFPHDYARLPELRDAVLAAAGIEVPAR